MIYKVSLPSILHGHLMPAEDSMLVEGRVFCVADGVTRDPISPKNITDLSTEDLLKKYPNPSGSRLAADLFCESFIKFLNKKIPTLKTIKNAFIYGNEKITELNKKNPSNIDYLVNDFFSCVASGGVIYNNKLYWGGICDCGIIIYDKQGKIKFQTPNWMKSFEKYEKKKLHKPDFNFSQAKYRKMVRSKYRNNVKMIVNNECVSYGALTGEKEAEQFMKFGEIYLDKGDLIVFYTDGFENTILHNRFFITIYQKTINLMEKHFIPYSLTLASQDYHKFGRERTLIAIVD